MYITERLENMKRIIVFTLLNLGLELNLYLFEWKGRFRKRRKNGHLSIHNDSTFIKIENERRLMLLLRIHKIRRNCYIGSCLFPFFHTLKVVGVFALSGSNEGLRTAKFFFRDYFGLHHSLPWVKLIWAQFVKHLCCYRDSGAVSKKQTNLLMPHCGK